ncbi:NYN domain-containing protein [Defluviimonas salinarum]|uniref:NYN domain-containing protein n=1 Tax=Defluviimonas salinarum TaxID=2992147 RepID=A0ABT3J8A0_9RHOB|nr:NYN domain-containing protein [Defluviimonas salinarum]MCW3783920.1 NYN domain-containing protein [Defluviimonas salinarum]
MFYKDERLALFIDGSGLHSAARSLGFEIDYKNLRAEFGRRGRLVRSAYYACVNEAEEFVPIKPLMDWLGYNGYAVTCKPVREFIEPGGRKKIKGSIGIELTVDAMTMAPHIDHAVIFSGDGDYRPLVEALQRQGVRVSIVCTMKSNPPMISDELRRQADNFIDVDDLREAICRSPRVQE